MLKQKLCVCYVTIWRCEVGNCSSAVGNSVALCMEHPNLTQDGCYSSHHHICIPARGKEAGKGSTYPFLFSHNLEVAGNFLPHIIG